MFSNVSFIKYFNNATMLPAMNNNFPYLLPRNSMIFQPQRHKQMPPSHFPRSAFGTTVSLTEFKYQLTSHQVCDSTDASVCSLSLCCPAVTREQNSNIGGEEQAKS